MKKYLLVLIIISLSYCKVNTETGSGPELLLISALTKLAEVKPTVTTDVYTVSTFAGTGVAGNTDGVATSASFNRPLGIAVDSSGNVFVSDYVNCRIRKVTTSGTVSTFVGSSCGYNDANGTSASIQNSTHIAVDSSGNFYLTDTNNYRIRKITASGDVTTFAGSGANTSTDGTGTGASLYQPRGILVDTTGTVYVGENGHVIRKISAAGVVTTLAGTAYTPGSSDGTGASVRFQNPFGIATDNTGNLFVADDGNNTIRKITIGAGTTTTYSGSSSEAGSTDGSLTVARFYSPNALVFDSSQNLYVVDRGNNKIRKITKDGTVSTIAGTGTAGSTDGDGKTATFNNPRAIAIDSSGNLYIADDLNHKIRKITITKVTVTK